MAQGLAAPASIKPALDARVEITNHYAFQKPGDSRRTILILNVNPLAPKHGAEFRHDAVYETLIDTNADAKPDIAFRYRFSPTHRKQQYARVTRVQLERELEDGHLEGPGEVLVDQAPVSFGSEPLVTTREHGIQFFAGLRSDPFFFDLNGFLDEYRFTGTDFFANLNVFGIVLDIPSRLLGAGPNVGIWTRTLVPMTFQPDHLTQVDRLGLPGINTVLNHGADRKSFSVEMLPFDYSSSAGYPNGRRLQDDVIDMTLGQVTDGKITTDGVGPHSDYLADFPYLGTPHPPA
jgi:hypothetical protein